MPPFKLENPDRDSSYHRSAKIIYTKNQYSEGIKVEHWQETLEHHPIDVDPYCPGKVNQFLSHYHRLGTINERSYGTTTHDMLDQIFIKDKMTPPKLMKNYYTFNDDAAYVEGAAPRVCADDFSTTMQRSYQMPRPYVMQRLAFRKVPYMQNRKYRHVAPDLSAEKFHDEDFNHVSCELRRHKGFRSMSYNPMTGDYTTAP